MQVPRWKGLDGQYAGVETGARAPAKATLKRVAAGKRPAPRSQQQALTPKGTEGCNTESRSGQHDAAAFLLTHNVELTGPEAALSPEAPC